MQPSAPDIESRDRRRFLAVIRLTALKSPRVAACKRSIGSGADVECFIACIAG